MSFLERDNQSNFQTKFPFSILRIWMSIGIFILPLFAVSLTRDTVNFPKFFFFIFFVVTAALIWLVSLVAVKGTVLHRSIIDPMLIIFLLGTLVSIVLSKDSGVSVLGRPDLFIPSGIFLFTCVAFAWLAIQAFHSEHHVLLLLRMIIIAMVVACLLFLFRSSFLIQQFTKITGAWDVVSPLHSIFALSLSIMTIISGGLLLINEKKKWIQCIPAAGLLIGFITLSQLNFRIAWIVYVLGFGLLIIIGASLVKLSSVARVSVIFVLFLLGLGMLLFSLPTKFRASLPVEIALGSTASWDIVRQGWLDSVKNFFVGSGQGTFRIDFSAYRSAAFNADPLTWTTRFAIPFSSALGLLSEMGIVGILGIIGVFLIGIGNAVSGWWRVRHAFIDAPLELSRACGPEYVTPSIIAAAWLSTTVALCVSYADVVLWFLWWVLLALLLISLSRIITGVIRQAVIRFTVSPQYALLFSFSLILLGFSVILLGVFGYKFYVSEVYFTRAIETGDLETQAQHVTKALLYRPSYPEYQLADARIAIERVRRLAATDSGSVEMVGQELSRAVEITKKITQEHPYNIEGWELLSVIYMNTRAITPEANMWAKNALDHAIVLEPSNPLFYWRRANVEMFEKNFEAAETSYMRSIELKPDYVLSYTDLAALYEEQGELTRAINLYQPIMPIVQDSADLLFALGRLFYNRNEEEDLDRAEQLWRRAEEVDGSHSNALYSLGLLYERQGKRSLAKQYIAKVQELNPNNQDVSNKLKSL